MPPKTYRPPNAYEKREKLTTGSIPIRGNITNSLNNGDAKVNDVPVNISRNNDVKDNPNSRDIIVPEKPLTFEAKYYKESEGIPFNQMDETFDSKENDSKTIKSFIDGYVEFKANDSAIRDGNIAVEFVIDMSGSMTSPCDISESNATEHQRIFVAMTAAKNLIMNMPKDIMISVTGFATKTVVLIDSVKIPDSEDERKTLCELITYITCGQDTAIHTNVDLRLQNICSNIEKYKQNNIKKIIVSVWTDGGDNSSKYSWNTINFKQDKGAKFYASLDVLHENYIKQINENGISIELMFIGIGPGADWNIIRALNNYTKISSSGRNINVDGKYAIAAFEKYLRNALNVASTDNQITFKLDPVSINAGVEIRILDTRCASKWEEKDDYGAASIISPFCKVKDFRYLSDISYGSTVCALFQIRFPLTNGKLTTFPMNFEGIGITATLSGMKLSPGKQMANNPLSTHQIVVPIIWDPKITKFTQSEQTKWPLRLAKCDANIRCTMNQAYELAEENKIPEIHKLIENVINNIKKDQDQCLAAYISEAELTKHYELRIHHPFYDPEDIPGTLVGAFTRQIEDMRIMMAYTMHESFAKEYKAKICEWLIPERRGKLVQDVFETTFMDEATFKLIYKGLLEHDITEEWEIVEDNNYNTKLRKRFKLIAQQVFNEQKKVNMTINHEALAAMVYVYLMNGMTPEQYSAANIAAEDNQRKTNARYIQRPRHMNPDANPSTSNEETSKL